MYFYCNHSNLFYYLEFVGGCETFLKNLSSVWDIFHVGFFCSAPRGCNNNSIAVVKLEQPRPTLFAIDFEIEVYTRKFVK